MMVVIDVAMLMVIIDVAMLMVVIDVAMLMTMQLIILGIKNRSWKII